MIEAFCDGACRGGNPGFCSCAYAIYFGGKLDTFGSWYLGPERKTNNHAEYAALIHLLEILFQNNIRNVMILATQSWWSTKPTKCGPWKATIYVRS